MIESRLFSILFASPHHGAVQPAIELLTNAQLLDLTCDDPVGDNTGVNLECKKDCSSTAAAPVTKRLVSNDKHLVGRAVPPCESSDCRVLTQKSALQCVTQRCCTCLRNVPQAYCLRRPWPSADSRHGRYGEMKGAGNGCSSRCSLYGSAA